MNINARIGDAVFFEENDIDGLGMLLICRAITVVDLEGNENRSLYGMAYYENGTYCEIYYGLDERYIVDGDCHFTANDFIQWIKEHQHSEDKVEIGQKLIVNEDIGYSTYIVRNVFCDHGGMSYQCFSEKSGRLERIQPEHVDWSRTIH
jgi:hypothetical protein